MSELKKLFNKNISIFKDINICKLIFDYADPRVNSFLFDDNSIYKEKKLYYSSSYHVLSDINYYRKIMKKCEFYIQYQVEKYNEIIQLCNIYYKNVKLYDYYWSRLFREFKIYSHVEMMYYFSSQITLISMNFNNLDLIILIYKNGYLIKKLKTFLSKIMIEGNLDKITKIFHNFHKSDIPSYWYRNNLNTKILDIYRESGYKINRKIIKFYVKKTNYDIKFINYFLSIDALITNTDLKKCATNKVQHISSDSKLEQETLKFIRLLMEKKKNPMILPSKFISIFGKNDMKEELCYFLFGTNKLPRFIEFKNN